MLITPPFNNIRLLQKSPSHQGAFYFAIFAIDKKLLFDQSYNYIRVQAYVEFLDLQTRAKNRFTEISFLGICFPP